MGYKLFNKVSTGGAIICAIKSEIMPNQQLLEYYEKIIEAKLKKS